MSIRSSKSSREAALLANQKLLQKVGYSNGKSSRPAYDWKKEYREKFGTTSIHLARDSWASGSTEKKSVTDSKWKRPYRDDEEREERERIAVEIAEQKGKSLAPAYNKGAYQPICPSELGTIGRKV